MAEFSKKNRLLCIFCWARAKDAIYYLWMESYIRVQGRELSSLQIEEIKQLIAANRDWHRTRLSQELCRLWGWIGHNGQPKDMACRTLLLKLHRRGLLELPARQSNNCNQNRANSSVQRKLDFQEEVICTDLSNLKPLELVLVTVRSAHADLFKSLLQQYHYLGYRTDVGCTLKYLVFDRLKRPLGCLLFASAAWKSHARDHYIGWSAQEREANLYLMANNTRFLIVPWVQVPNLASYLLGRIAKRLSGDWRHRYGHQLVLLETFVERDRFLGTCYRAANWANVGQTTGRSRQDRHHRLQVGVKDIYLYPLKKDFRQWLIN